MRCFWGNRKGRVPPRRTSHVGVVRALTTLRNDPVDVLGRVLDVAGLAVDAVLVIDLEARRLALLAHHLVDAGRAIALRRLVINRQVLADRDLWVLELKVDLLVFLMIGA